MLPLDDPRWQTYIGGYQVRYDASETLSRLLSDGPGDGIYDVLSNELCHQGDLGSASYAALPWLVEYLRRTSELDAWIAGLVLTIEFGRPFHPQEIPSELQPGYDEAIREFPEIVLSKRDGNWDDTQTQVAAAALAMGQGNLWFARTYFELDRLMIEHLMKEEFGHTDWDWP